jgi:adenylyltransferase/sulfurtransferase
VKTLNPKSQTAKHVVIVGAGGNIGSHVTAHVARMAEVGRVTLVDPDRYEAKNVASQDITRGDIGAHKVAVQGRRVRRVAGRDVEVVPIAGRIEEVPAGRLLSDVIVACLDSRAARQHVNQIAWRLGIPWIDAGVEPTLSLARVNVYSPALDSPCLECAWSDADYAALEQTYPCQGLAGRPTGRGRGAGSSGSTPVKAAGPPTNAPSYLGALAASLQAIECHKLLRGELDRAVVGRQVLVDAASHRHYVTAFSRREACRMRPHRPLAITRMRYGPREVTLGALFERAARDGLGRRDLALEVEGLRLAIQQTCENPACGRRRPVWRFGLAWTESRTRCDACGGSLHAEGFDLRERVEASSAPPSLLERTLGQLGLRRGELCTVSAAETNRHYLLGDDRA